MGTRRWCPHCRQLATFEPWIDPGDYKCTVCGNIDYGSMFLPKVPEYQLGYRDKSPPAGYIDFHERVSTLGKSESAVRYDIAISNYPVLTTSIKQDGRCLYLEDLVDLTAKTGIVIRYIDGALIIKASEAGRIMDVSSKTAIADIRAEKISGWYSGHYFADMKNVLDRANLHKPVSSGHLYRDTLRLFQGIHDLVASGRPSS